MASTFGASPRSRSPRCDGIRWRCDTSPPPGLAHGFDATAPSRKREGHGREHTRSSSTAESRSTSRKAGRRASGKPVSRKAVRDLVSKAVVGATLSPALLLTQALASHRAAVPRRVVDSSVGPFMPAEGFRGFHPELFTELALKEPIPAEAAAVFTNVHTVRVANVDCRGDLSKGLLDAGFPRLRAVQCQGPLAPDLQVSPCPNVTSLSTTWHDVGPLLAAMPRLDALQCDHCCATGTLRRPLRRLQLRFVRGWSDWAVLEASAAGLRELALDLVTESLLGDIVWHAALFSALRLDRLVVTNSPRLIGDARWARFPGRVAAIVVGGPGRFSAAGLLHLVRACGLRRVGDGLEEPLDPALVDEAQAAGCRVVRVAAASVAAEFVDWPVSPGGLPPQPDASPP